jgi:hypothetical protein
MNWFLEKLFICFVNVEADPRCNIEGKLQEHAM